MAQEGVQPVGAWQLAAAETSRLEAAFSNAVFSAADLLNLAGKVGLKERL